MKRTVRSEKGGEEPAYLVTADLSYVCLYNNREGEKEKNKQKCEDTD